MKKNLLWLGLKISLEIGRNAEKKAIEYLKSIGYSIKDINFYSRFGEIDIICEKDSVLHFMEVKYSQKSDPITRITSSKLTKIIKTIDYYMYNKNIDLDYQIDAILVNDKQIEIVENISY